MTTGRLLGVHELTVDGDLEDPTPRGNEHEFLELVLEFL
jgi:hypothetical protein